MRGKYSVSVHPLTEPTEDQNYWLFAAFVDDKRVGRSTLRVDFLDDRQTGKAVGLAVVLTSVDVEERFRDSVDVLLALVCKSVSTAVRVLEQGQAEYFVLEAEPGSKVERVCGRMDTFVRWDQYPFPFLAVQEGLTALLGRRCSSSGS